MIVHVNGDGDIQTQIKNSVIVRDSRTKMEEREQGIQLSKTILYANTTTYFYEFDFNPNIEYHNETYQIIDFLSLTIR